MSKRGQGEGNLYRRADGRWAARVRVGYLNGKALRRWVYGKTRAEASRKLATIIRAHDQGMMTSADGRLTVQQFLRRWLDESARPKLRPRTLASYEQVVRLHIIPALGRIPLQKLAPQQVQAWLNERSAVIGPRTCHYARAILRSALAQALRWGVVSRNVAALVQPPRVPHFQIKPLHPEQARALLKAAAGHRLSALLSVAIGLGLRQGEALGLQWECIDLDKRSLRVQVRFSTSTEGGNW